VVTNTLSSSSIHRKVRVPSSPLIDATGVQLSSMRATICCMIQEVSISCPKEGANAEVLIEKPPNPMYRQRLTHGSKRHGRPLSLRYIIVLCDLSAMCGCLI